MSMFSFEDSFELFKSLIIASGIKNCSYLRFLPNAPYGYVTSKETLSAIAYKNPDLLLPDSEHMGTYHFAIQMLHSLYTIRVLMEKIRNMFLVLASLPKIQPQSKWLTVLKI